MKQQFDSLGEIHILEFTSTGVGLQTEWSFYESVLVIRQHPTSYVKLPPELMARRFVVDLGYAPERNIDSTILRTVLRHADEYRSLVNAHVASVDAAKAPPELASPSI